ncbi:hypothetical protein [Geofilum rubicundum]|uniref:Uncharacterized protein n=1 Tax=Geofilum rubicundum JCM 15548 TaxID=1236989 RepID=A0A0E9LS58_9BACT|nr:hypothetical protein [Geofilum rubicundum]GAO28128.1 hypothetical protein JCM15548_190 [Geofilum rubicundum JCM 15548]
MFKYISTGLTLSHRFFKEELLAIFKDTGALLILFLALIIYPVIYGVLIKRKFYGTFLWPWSIWMEQLPVGS